MFLGPYLQQANPTTNEAFDAALAILEHGGVVIRRVEELPD